MKLPARSPLLTAKNLVKVYGDKYVVADISLELSQGEVLGFLGPNGAGKSTTIGMLYGAVTKTSGAIKILGFDIAHNGRKAREVIGVVTQDDNLDTDLTATENIVNFAHLHKITGQAAQTRAEELLDLVGIRSYASYLPEALSGGLKRRLTLARALVHRPKIIFLDEPTTGLDPQSRQEFWKAVAHLRDAGAGIILTTHYMDEAERLSDRLILLQQGKIVREDKPAELVHTIAGLEVGEIKGVPEDQVVAVAERFNTWWYALGSGYAIGLGSDTKNSQSVVWQAIEALGVCAVEKLRRYG